MNKLDSATFRDDLDRDIVVIDIGCRWGFADAFMHDLDKFQLYGFDPDVDECARLEALYASERINIVPKGLGEREGVAKLYITKEPACSSLFEPIAILTQNFPGLGCAEKISEKNIDLTTLDLWSAQAGIEFADHIKIDTQGSELSILKGSKNILNTARTLEVEVEFNPIYDGQPLFSDVDMFLRGYGFVLWKFTHFVHYGKEGDEALELGIDIIHHNGRSQKIKKLGGQVYWANAHYVKADIANSAVTDRKQLIRDILLLNSLGHADLVKRLVAVLNRDNRVAQ